jgi:hypothetical protein
MMLEDTWGKEDDDMEDDDMQQQPMNPVNIPGHRFYVSVERRQELCSYDITLNGARASIAGATNDFATVRQLPDGLSAYFAWSTVERIILNHKGRFNA